MDLELFLNFNFFLIHLYYQYQYFIICGMLFVNLSCSVHFSVQSPTSTISIFHIVVLTKYPPYFLYLTFETQNQTTLVLTFQKCLYLYIRTQSIFYEDILCNIDYHSSSPTMMCHMDFVVEPVKKLRVQGVIKHNIYYFRLFTFLCHATIELLSYLQRMHG